MTQHCIRPYPARHPHSWFLLLGLLLPTATFALDLFVRSPRPGKAVFGAVRVEAEVLTEQPVTVQLQVDGQVVGQLTQAPFTWTVDVGEDNREHLFTIVATNANGETVTREITTPALKVDLELDLGLQQLYVTVTRDGQRLLDLSLDDFAVFDEGEAQEIITFERGDVPLTAVLLLDASSSMVGAPLQSALAGAQAFVAGMRELDRARLIAFADRTRAASEETGDPQVVAAAMTGLRAAGGTAVNDHLFLALELLAQRQGRRVIILLSDGVDVESVVTMAQVRTRLQSTNALLYWIRPPTEAGRGHRSAWRDGAEHRREYEMLLRAAQASGGRVVELASIEQASAAFREILAELREQYVFGYYPSVQKGSGTQHRVQVRARPPRTRVRAAEGYVER